MWNFDFLEILGVYFRLALVVRYVACTIRRSCWDAFLLLMFIDMTITVFSVFIGIVYQVFYFWLNQFNSAF